MEIAASDVKKLREMTGAGMMECKEALVEAKGNFDEAQKILRKKGAATAAKKATRTAVEGLIGSYVHMGGKIGVLVEVSCETDFVARNEDFVVLAREIAMHIAASSPRYATRDQVPADVLETEREIARALAKKEGKPDHIIEKIVEGRLNKFYEEVCLLEQPFVRNGDMTVKDLVDGYVLKFKENISVRRFVRFAVGE